MCLRCIYLLSSVSPTFLWVRPMCKAHYPWWLKFSGVSVPKLSSCDLSFICSLRSLLFLVGGRRSSAVACWASDHWVASSNPLRGKFRR